MIRRIETNYDTVAVDIDGVEHVAIPVYEDQSIFLYRLPSGGVVNVRGLLSLPEDAEFVDSYDAKDCEDADAVYEKCERILSEVCSGGC